MKLKLSHLLILLVLFFINNTVYSQTATARWLFLKPSAQSMALGGTGAGYHLNTFSAYFNPAAIAYGKKISLSVSGVKPYPFFPDVASIYTGISGKIHEQHVISLNHNSFRHSTQQVLNENGSVIDTVDSKTSWHLKLAYAFQINQNFSVGLGLGYLSYNLLDREFQVGSETRSGETSAITIDLGFFAQNLIPKSSYRLSDKKHEGLIAQLAEEKIHSGFSVGISILNLGSDVTFIDDNQADPLPGFVLLGFSYWPISSNWLGLQIVTDLEKHIHDSSTLNFARFGGELQIYQLLALRGGYVLDTFGLKKSYPTWGFGICTKYGSINIARYNPTFLSTWHFDIQLQLEF